jgi:spore germination protein KC
MFRKTIMLVLVIVIMLAGGCWDRHELNELAVVLGAGVDRLPDGRVRLTLQLARPSAFAGGERGGADVSMNQNIAWVMSAAGETVADAQHNLALQVSRRITWTHNIVLIFGEAAARHGVRDFTNFFHREAGPRETMWVMVAEGEAKKVLESHSELEKTSAQSSGFLARSRAGFATEFIDFIKDLASRGTNPVAARVSLVRRGEAQGPGMEKVHKHEEVVFTGAAVFKDDRLAGWLDRGETRGLQWLRGEMEKGAIVFSSAADPDKKITFKIIRSKTRVDPYRDGEKAGFRVEIFADVDLEEQQSQENILDPETIKEMEERAAAEIEGRCRDVLAKARDEYGLDIFRFGEAFHRKYKKEWPSLKHRWDEEFTRSDVCLAVKVHLHNMGLQTMRSSLKK